MTYRAPVTEQRFLLDVVTGIGDIAANERFMAATPDTIDAILNGAAQLAEREFAPLNQQGDRDGARLTEDGVMMPYGFTPAYKAYVEGGWGGLTGSAEHGGQGLPFSLAVPVMEDLGSANMAFSLCMLLTPGAVEALTVHGSAEQQKTWLPKLISGEWSGTMNLTEPQAGSDVGALKTSAQRQDDGSYRIKGSKIFITFGEHDLTGNIVHLVLARTPDAPAGTKGISMFLVPRYRLDKAGQPSISNDVRCVSLEHKLGIHASPTCVMSYGDNDDCIGHLIGEENGGMRAMFTMMNNARLNVGLQGVSIAERARQQAAAYARERVQSSRAGSSSREPVPIIQHPDVRRMLMTMRALTEAARALAYHAAGLIDRGRLGDGEAQARANLLIPMVKAYGTDVGVEVASMGVQVHGGMGFIEETGAAQHYRDARIAPIYEGTNGIQAADLVGRKLGLENGDVFRALIADIRAAAVGEETLRRLVDQIDRAGARMLSADMSADDRLAASSPFLRMLAVAVSGWLMALQAAEAARRVEQGEGDSKFHQAKLATTRFYLDQIVPQAEGLFAAATAGADALYAIDEETLSR